MIEKYLGVFISSLVLSIAAASLRGSYVTICGFEGKKNTISKDEKEFIENDFETKTYKWKEYAVEKLGWTKEVMYSVLATPAKVLDTKGSIAIKKKTLSNNSMVKTRSETDSTPDCECSLESDWCSGMNSCKESDCKIKRVGFLPDGCGTILYYDCDGMCK